MANTDDKVMMTYQLPVRYKCAQLSDLTELLCSDGITPNMFFHFVLLLLLNISQFGGEKFALIKS